MNIKQQLTTVTTFSKIVSLCVFIILPFLGFYLGMKFQASVNTSTAPVDAVQSSISTISPTSTDSKKQNNMPPTWTGEYYYFESAPTQEYMLSNKFWNYDLILNSSDNKYTGMLILDGYETFDRLSISAVAGNDRLDVYFDHFNNNLVLDDFDKNRVIKKKVLSQGDLLLSLIPQETNKFSVIWNKLQPNIPNTTAVFQLDIPNPNKVPIGPK